MVQFKQKSRPKQSLAIKDKVLKQIGISSNQIICEVSGVVYEGGYVGLSPDTSLFGTLHNEGNIIITANETFFVTTTFFLGKLKAGFSIPHETVNKSQIQQNTGNLMNTQQTLGATAGLGSIGLAAGAFKKATRVQIPFKEEGINHTPTFMFRKNKDSDKFLNTFLKNI